MMVHKQPENAWPLTFMLPCRWIVYSLASMVGMFPEQAMCVFIGYSVDNVQELLNSGEKFDKKEVLL